MTALRMRLITQVEKLGVENRPLPGRDDGFSSLHYRNEALARPTQRVHPNRSKNSPWIELQFYSSADVDRIVALITLAIPAL